MTDSTEQAAPSGADKDAIKQVLQTTLMQQALTLLKFTSSEALALQIPETDIHIFAGPRRRIVELLGFGLPRTTSANIVQDVLELFGACGFEVRPDNPQFAVVGSLDAAGILVDAVLEHSDELARRCRAQRTNKDTESSDLAPTTSTATASGSARDEILEEAARACESEVVEDSGLPEQENHNYAVNQCAKLIRALKSQSASAQASQAAASEPEQIECWSRDEEDFNARSLSELLDSHDDLKPGDTVWVGEAVHPDPARLVNEDGIIENIGEAAYDIGGEYAEDYPEVTTAQAKELESLVADWIKRTCPPTFYTVENVKPYVLSHEDFPHDRTPINVELPSELRTNPATPASKGDA